MGITLFLSFLAFHFYFYYHLNAIFDVAARSARSTALLNNMIFPVVCARSNATAVMMPSESVPLESNNKNE